MISVFAQSVHPTPQQTFMSMIAYAPYVAAVVVIVYFGAGLLKRPKKY